MNRARVRAGRSRLRYARTVSPDRRPVFHDPSGRRQRWTLRVSLALGAALLVLAAIFLLSLVAVPILPPTIGLSEPIRRQLKPHLVAPPGRESRLSTFLLQKERRQLLRQLAHDERALLKVANGRLLQPVKSPAPVIAAFYATWQETGLHSLRANADRLTHLFPLWLGIPDAAAVARACDLVVLMAYDQHYMAGEAGPLCGIEWYRDLLDRTLASMPPAKLVIGLGNYAYDWTNRKPPAEAISYQEALYLASDNHPERTPAEVVDFDSRALNSTFEYEDEAGRTHEVWMLDAITAANQRTLARARGVRGSVLWVLGEEDPAVWTMLDR